MKTVSIFGGTGYIGSHLTGVLANRGYNVRVFTRSLNDQSSASCMDNVEYVERCKYDDREYIKENLLGSDIIINLVGTWDSNRRRLNKTQVEFPTMLFEIAQDAGISKMIHMSWLGVGHNGNSPYLKSKLAAEESLLGLAKNSKVELNIVRSSMLLGHEDPFSYMMGRMLHFFPVFPLPMADTIVQPIVLDDLINFFMALIDAAPSEKEIYEVAGPEEFTLYELVTKMAEHIHGHGKRVKKFPKLFTNVMTKLFGWIPGSPLTRNQYLTAQIPSRTDNNALLEFGITPTPVDALFDMELGEKVLDKYYDDRLTARRPTDVKG